MDSSGSMRQPERTFRKAGSGARKTECLAEKSGLRDYYGFRESAILNGKGGRRDVCRLLFFLQINPVRSAAPREPAARSGAQTEERNEAMSLIYIVEYDTDIQEVENIAMRSSGHETACFGDAESFMKAIGEKQPDLVLLDVMLPDKNGDQIVRELRADRKYHRLPVIMVTAKTAEIDMLRGLDNGADDYICKPFSVMELISRVRALLRRSEPGEMTETILTSGCIRMDIERHRVYVTDKPVLSGDSAAGEGETVELTNREFELLRFLLENQGIVLSRDSILRNVWDTDFEGETRTVDMHIKTLRQKLGSASSQIKTVRGVGYVCQ